MRHFHRQNRSLRIVHDDYWQLHDLCRSLTEKFHNNQLVAIQTSPWNLSALGKDLTPTAKWKQFSLFIAKTILRCTMYPKQTLMKPKYPLSWTFDLVTYFLFLILCVKKKLKKNLNTYKKKTKTRQFLYHFNNRIHLTTNRIYEYFVWTGQGLLISTLNENGRYWQCFILNLHFLCLRDSLPLKQWVLMPNSWVLSKLLWCTFMEAHVWVLCIFIQNKVYQTRNPTPKWIPAWLGN